MLSKKCLNISMVLWCFWAPPPREPKSTAQALW